MLKVGVVGSYKKVVRKMKNLFILWRICKTNWIIKILK